jgi:hypothetical protein
MPSAGTAPASHELPASMICAKLLTRDEARRIAANIAKAAGASTQGRRLKALASLLLTLSVDAEA